MAEQADATTWTDEELIVALNDLMGQYAENPQRFESPLAAATRFKADCDAGREPSHGRVLVLNLRRIAGKGVAVINEPPAPPLVPQDESVSRRLTESLPARSAGAASPAP